MDCIEAQAAISEALDRSPVDAAVLEDAKTHCRECAQCGQYVRALNAVRRAPLPQPPADLADRIVAAVRAEAAASERASIAQDEAAATAAALEAALEDGRDGAGETLDAPSAEGTAPIGLTPGGSATLIPTPVGLPESPASPPRITVGGTRLTRNQAIAWGSAAAVVLLVAGISSALGILQWTKGTDGGGGREVAGQTAAPLAASPQVLPYAGETKLTDETGAPDATALSRTEAGGEGTLASAGVYVVFRGSTYLHQGVSAEAKDDLEAAGEVRMTFDAATPPELHTVYTGKESETIRIENSQGELQRLVLVTRSYEGTVYRLQSADIAAFGEWPRLPSGVSRPVPEDNPTGEPAFALDGTDAAGVSVYHLAGSDRSAGIAIPPGTPVTDPAAGNPHWTWWVP